MVIMRMILLLSIIQNGCEMVSKKAHAYELSQTTTSPEKPEEEQEEMEVA